MPFFQSDIYVCVDIVIYIYTLSNIKNIEVFILYILGNSIDSDVQKQNFQVEPKIQSGRN